MRYTTSGYKVRLGKELLDIVFDYIPECKQNDDFFNDRNKKQDLEDSLIEAIKEHLTEVTA